jgi:hypothetical protein
VGLKRKSHKFPVLVEHVASGTRYKFKAETVTKNLKAKDPAKNLRGE